MVDPYAILGLHAGADPAAIRAAYRRLARAFHPDVNRAPDATARMCAINLAYRTLCAAPVLAVRPSSPAPASPGRRWGAAVAGTRFGLLALLVLLGVLAVAASRPAISSLSAPAHSAAPARHAGAVAPGALAERPSEGSPPAASDPQRAQPVRPSHADHGRPGSGAEQDAAGCPCAPSGTRAGDPPPTVGSGDARAPLAPLPVSGGTSPLFVAPAVRGPGSESAFPAAEGASGGPSVSSARGAQGETAAPVEGERAPPQAGKPAQPAAMPAVPVVPAGRSGAPPHIQAVAVQDAGEPASTAAARRALATLDRAWMAYSGALRLAAAASLAPGAGAEWGARAAGAGPAALLSSDSQVSLARALYLEAQLSWSRQASSTLATLSSSTARPDGAGAARAALLLREAAGLVAQAQASGAPAPVQQVRLLLDEADQLHRAWVANWARYLAERAD